MILMCPGDCTAVIGSLSDTDTWVAKKLTHEHNSDNQNEVGRNIRVTIVLQKLSSQIR